MIGFGKTKEQEDARIHNVKPGSWNVRITSTSCKPHHNIIEAYTDNTTDGKSYSSNTLETRMPRERRG